MSQFEMLNDRLAGNFFTSKVYEVVRNPLDCRPDRHWARTSTNFQKEAREESIYISSNSYYRTALALGIFFLVPMV